MQVVIVSSQCVLLWMFTAAIAPSKCSTSAQPTCVLNERERHHRIARRLIAFGDSAIAGSYCGQSGGSRSGIFSGSGHDSVSDNVSYRTVTESAVMASEIEQFGWKSAQGTKADPVPRQLSKTNETDLSQHRVARAPVTSGQQRPNRRFASYFATSPLSSIRVH